MTFSDKYTSMEKGVYMILDMKRFILTSAGKLVRFLPTTDMSTCEAAKYLFPKVSNRTRNIIINEATEMLVCATRGEPYEYKQKHSF